jgi:hypothetical protein
MRRVTMSLALVFATTGTQLGCSEPDTAQVEWTVASRPSIVIADDGTAPTQFARMAGAVRLASGEIAIADADAAEVRLFAPDGIFEKTLVHRGAGPGEMNSVGWLAQTRSGIVVGSRSQVLLLPADGSSPDMYYLARYSARPTSSTLIGALGSGSFVATRSRSGFKVLPSQDQMLRDTVQIAILPPRLEGEPRSIGDFPYQTNLTLVHAGAPGGLKIGKHEFAPQLLIAPGDSILWIGDSESAVLVRIELGYSSTREVLLPIPPREWDEQAIAAVLQRVASSVMSEADRYFALAQLDDRWRPEHPPYFRSLTADVGGGVWVELFKEDAAAAPECLVLDRDGNAVARVRLPHAGRIAELGANYVLVVERDDLDVERVAVYELERGH